MVIITKMISHNIKEMMDGNKSIIYKYGPVMRAILSFMDLRQQY